MNRNRLRVLCTASLLALLPGIVVADPAGDYEGWTWDSIVFGTPVSLNEEFCFGPLTVSFEVDNNWDAGSSEVCWGRSTISIGRFFDNPPPFTIDVGDPTESTRPWVAAGGNLYEFFGEDVEGGVGQGEERVATIITDASTDNLLVTGDYFELEEVGAVAGSRQIVVAVKSTPSTKAARTAADLEGTNWRMPVMFHSITDTGPNTEFAVARVGSLSFGAGGICNFTNSSVFPEVIDNSDLYRAFAFNDGTNFDDQTVSGGLDSRAATDCTYSIDSSDRLAVTRTSTRAAAPGNPEVESFVYTVSDNNQFLVPAPADSADDYYQAVGLGYRQATSLAATAIDDDYLFYLFITEFGADGAGAAAAGFGPRSWQQFDGMGKGRVSFDSTTAGTLPSGETGSWKQCAAEMQFGSAEYDLTGTVAMADVRINEISVDEEVLTFDDCSFRLAADGGLDLYLVVLPDPGEDNGFTGVLRGYTNDNGDVLTLIQNTVEGDPVNFNKDISDIKFIFGLRFDGDLDADADGDGYTNYEEFRFPFPDFAIADQDTNDDGRSDILFRNSATGAHALYLMNGLTIEQNLSVSSVPTSWSIVGRGDYDGSGTADILWRFGPTGAVWVYRMDGNTVQASEFIGTVADSDWQVVGNGDYNGDGFADILWQHQTNGTVWLYQMEGSTILQSGGIGVVPDTNWKIVGNGDYNGDGRSDILWRNIANGANWMYLMNGQTIGTSIGISVTPDLNWDVVGNGDYDGDGKSDILWRNSVSGTNWMYLMDGTSIASSGSVSVLPDPNWIVVGDGDYNGDGFADVLWRNQSTGTNYLYLMNGLSIDDAGTVSVVSDQNWQIVNTP